MPNKLNVNQPRIGWYFDGLPDEVTPPTATMLLDDGEQIKLTLPWRSTSPTNQIERWFHGATTHFGDDPDRSQYTYEVPPELSFVDVDGPVGLLGCTSAGYRSQLLRGVGQGTIAVRATVFGTDSLRYNRVNGFRTVIPELAEWIGKSSVKETTALDDAGRVTQLELTLSAPASVSLTRRMNLKIAPTWRMNRSAYGPNELHDEMYIETMRATPCDWEAHLTMHQSVRELLDLAAWEPFGFEQLQVHRIDDPVRMLSGDLAEPRWCDVRTYAVRQRRPSSDRPRYWFLFADIGTAGYRRWLAMRSKYERAVVPMLSLLGETKGFVETQLYQSSMALEALGYEVALDRGHSAKSAGNLRFTDRLQLVEQALPIQVTKSDWPTRAADAYNGLKHANRPLPDLVTMMNVVRENTLVFRTWAVSALGISADKLSRAVSIDRDTQALRQQGLGSQV